MLPSGIPSQPAAAPGARSPSGQGGGQPYKPRLCQLREGSCWPDFHGKTIFPPVNNQSSTTWVENAYVGGVLKPNSYGT